MASTGVPNKGVAWLMLAWLLPTRCPLCEDATAGRKGCCAFCWAEAIDAGGEGATLWLGDYEGRLGDAVSALKYRRGSRLGKALGRELGRTVADHGWRFAWVVSVPLHPTRVAERGYDQAEHLARAAARELDVPYRQALRRTRATRSQVGLDRNERQRNVQGAFEVRESVRYPVLLVDDVLTTGATTNACIAALRAAGCPRVYVGVVARAGY